MIIPRYYEDLNILHENTMPARAYYIPASKQVDTSAGSREASDRIQMLNGKWKFRYYRSIYELKDAFYELDYDALDCESVNVPGVWQMEGYDAHQYTNIRFRSIRHMSRRTTPAARMCIRLTIMRMRERQRFT